MSCLLGALIPLDGRDMWETNAWEEYGHPRYWSPGYGWV